MSTSYTCGYAALIGRPNVGKSTLLNHILAQKLCITSAKPQTTRQRILGVKTEGKVQTIYVDTPGMHRGQQKALNRQMNQEALSSLRDVDVIVWLIEAGKFTEEDEWVSSQLVGVTTPIILALNKVDKVENKDRLLPQIQRLNEKYQFAAIIPISAATGDNVLALQAAVSRYLPVGEHLFAASDITDKSERFLVAELIREKIFRSLGQELPYSTTVSIQEFKQEENLTRIHAIIWVEKPGQKGIVIGKGGEKLKVIATAARKEIELLLQTKVFLDVWVKVKASWTDDERILKSLGL